MTAGARILVATDVVSDAGVVAKLLRDEFDDVVTSVDPDRAVQDFEKHRPAVLVLAFNTLEKAERYYLGLYRLSAVVHASPHRTLILCNQDDLRRVYALCKKEYFDDYILFWPMTHDMPRLPMAVHHALRQMANATAGPATQAEIVAQARRIAQLETLLEEYAASGSRHIETASHSLHQAGQEMGAALDSLSHELSEGGMRSLVDVKDRTGFQREINRLKAQEIDRRVKAVAAAVEPVRQWVGALKEQLAPQLDSARALGALVALIRPIVLLVDDDEFQHKLVRQLLSTEHLELVVATHGIEALSLMRRRRPDMVLMDVELPDIDGVEATRRLKSVDAFAAIPVVMVTGKSEKQVVVESLNAGASDFIVKPFDKATLLAKIGRFLHNYPPS